VLVIGSAGGQETKAALMYGASAVDAVEMVASVIELVKGPYAQFSGGLFNDPRVAVHAMEGRSFLRATPSTWDIIQIHSNHTSSSVAAGTGAMAPNYLQTAEAYRDYFTHLTREGVLHVNHFGIARMITTAALAWRQMGRTDFQRHVVVFGMKTPRDTLPTLMIRMRPWTPAEVDDLQAFFAGVNQDEFAFELLQNPVNASASLLSAEFFSGDVSDALASAMDVRIRPTTDDWPFFNFLRKRIGPVDANPATFMDPATAYMLNSQLRNDLIPMDLVHLLVTAVVSLFFAALFLVVPLYRSDIREARSSVKVASIVYFSSLGAGFVVFELVFIQVFMKLIGYPVYTYVLVISTMLFAAGAGSALSPRLGIHPGRRWYWPFAAVCVYGAALAIAHPLAIEYFLSAADAVRMMAAVVLMFPLGFFLGMPFPLGILVAERQSRAAVAWAWGLNGLFSVIGSLASALLGIAIGFQATLLIAVGLYVLASVAFASLRVTVVEAVATPVNRYVELGYVEEARP
jgi:hypothetical protein